MRDDPDAEQHPREAVPQRYAQEEIEEDEQARRHRSFGGGPVDRVVFRFELEQLVEEAEVHAKIAKHAPRNEGGGRKNDLVIGRENRRQEDGEQTRQTEHHAVEQLPLTHLEFVVDRLPDEDPREPLRR